MKQRRLVWLVSVMSVLAVVRVLAPPARDVPPAVAEAIVRRSPSTHGKMSDAPTSARAVTSAFAEPPATDNLDIPGNAFAVRPPPAPPYVPPAPKLAQAKAAAPPPVVAPIAVEPPAPPMPYQVIGTWDDGKEPGVFLSSPNGTLLARTGATLQAEYKVTAITPQQISLQHLASKREVRLAVPRPPQTSVNLPPRLSP